MFILSPRRRVRVMTRDREPPAVHFHLPPNFLEFIVLHFLWVFAVCGEHNKMLYTIVFFTSRLPKLFTSLGGRPHDCVPAFNTYLTRYVTCSQRRHELVSLFDTRCTEEWHLRTPRPWYSRCSRRWMSNVGSSKRCCKNNVRPAKNDIE